jgi:hypothetical protein
MPYAAVITSEAHAPNLLEDIAPSFCSPIATIRKFQNRWILQSSTFEPYESDGKLFEAANNLLTQIHLVLALYLGRYSEPLSVRALMMLTDDDKLIGHRRYFTQTFSVVMPAEQVFNPTASGSLATVVLSRAVTDPAITEALSLVGHEALTWGRIYDIIEFLGGPSSIKKAGFASEHKAAHMKRTANHYRHLGNPAKYPLPSNPSTLAEARMFAIDLVRRWIAERTSGSQ